MNYEYEIPDNEIPIKQTIQDIPIHFIDGTVCEVGGYEFEVIEDKDNRSEK
jgi:hypothetical protein